MNVIKTKFIFKKKDEGSGNFRFKARLVAQGFSQIEGVDYEETFSGVVDKVSLRAAIHFMASEDMRIFKFDVPTAFLNAPIEEEIFISLPVEVFDTQPNEVFRLRQALYGLKQAPRAWSMSFASALAEINFTPVPKDPSLYVMHGTQGGSNVEAILATHVDDGLMGVRDAEMSNKIVRFLVDKYGVRIIPNPDSFLGIDLGWEKPKRMVNLRQTKYIEKVSEKFRVNSQYPAKVPMAKSQRLVPRRPEEMPCVRPYRELVGCLIYVSTCTRPDISFAVNKHAQYFSDPSEEHFDSALRILSYLNSTKELGINLGGRSSARPEIKVYADSDFAEDPDTRLSTTGNLIYIDGSLVSWASKKQKLVATSTTEAEFLSVFYTLRDTQYLDQLLKGIFPSQKFRIRIFQDNISTVSLIKNQSSKGRTKHFDVKLRAVNSAFIEGFFEIEITPSELMLADIMTKPVTRNILQRLRPFIVSG